MTSQGSPSTRFQRALATRNPTLATAAAHELERVRLEDALRLVLLYREAGDRRFERGALRWHTRLCAETPAMDLAGVSVSAQALLTIAGADVDVERGVQALAELLEGVGLSRSLAALDEWGERPRER